MYICLCRGATERDVEQLGEAGFTTPSAIAAALRLKDDDCCGRCLRDVESLVEIACSGQDACAAKCPVMAGVAVKPI